MGRRPELVAVVCICGVATAFGTAMVLNRPEDRDPYVRPAPPPPVGVFREGGAPRRDAAIEAVLGEAFPRLVAQAELVRARAPGDDMARRALLADLTRAPAFAAHGPALAGAWRDMLGALDTWMVMEPGDRGFDGKSRELRARIDAVSDQLAAAELGYFLDPEIVGAPHPRRRAGIFAYRVEDVSFVRANDRPPVRVLGARALGEGSGVAQLGMSQDELDDPVVLLDQVDAKIEKQILPVLAGRVFPIGTDGWADTIRGREIEAGAALAIRRELLAALYTDASSPERAAARTRELIYQSVRHHEAQHAIDRDQPLAYPPALSTRLGDRKADPFAVRSRYELSAYLSQIAADTWLPQLSLWNLLRHGFYKGTRREESYVAVVVVEALARQLNIQPVGPIIRDGVIDRDRLARLALPLATRSTAELRRAAAASWRELFGAPLVRLYD